MGDFKEEKTLNFHQMELDDRILKVSNSRHSILSVHLQNSLIFSGNSTFGMAKSNIDPGKSDSSSSGR